MKMTGNLETEKILSHTKAPAMPREYTTAFILNIYCVNEYSFEYKTVMNLLDYSLILQTHATLCPDCYE